VVKGNHDEEACLNTSLESLNPLAAHALKWTREALTDADREWLAALKLVRQVRDFTIVHATLDTPGGWGYVTNKFDAMASFSYQFTTLCFHGHTHSPRFYVKHGSVEALSTSEVQLEMGKKYFVNAGSVGQPRDGIGGPPTRSTMRRIRSSPSGAWNTTSPPPSRKSGTPVCRKCWPPDLPPESEPVRVRCGPSYSDRQAEFAG